MGSVLDLGLQMSLHVMQLKHNRWLRCIYRNRIASFDNVLKHRQDGMERLVYIELSTLGDASKGFVHSYTKIQTKPVARTRSMNRFAASFLRVEKR